MKPHDEWRSADNARRAMQMETVDYGDEPEPTLPLGWWIWVYLVWLVFVALVFGVLLAVSRMW